MPMSLDAPRRRRTLDERLFVARPGLAASVRSRILALPPRSRLRRTLVARAVRAGFHAYNRRDFELLLLTYDPAVELEVHHVGGLEGRQHGHEGWRRYWSWWLDAWDDSWQAPTEVIDFDDDRLLILGLIRCRDRSREIELEERFAMLMTFRDGLIVRHEEWFDPRAGLAAAGLE